MRKSLTVAVAGAAIAATAVAATASVANASTSAPRKATTLSIVEAKTTITAGQLDIIRGALRSHGTPVPHRVIILDKLVAKHWKPVEEKFTNKRGVVGFAVKPAATTAYRLYWHGGPVYAPTHSGIVIVRVKPAPPAKTATALTETVSSGTITAGSTDTVEGALTSDSAALARHFVWLATLTNGKAHLLRARETDKAGDVTFTVAPPATTTYELVFRGDHKFAASVSEPLTITVTPAPAA